ncbi:hypothetical protein [Sphingomonas xinjiangensis]|uniref:Uncharacterized protein n=1 Tax=Sphingomonas xinjiangensis TaxID=643568 RepID=A0A840YTY6_9SPHN|nr:hypothetical protein [Sphingomonas xinjiangensis]MBB5713125.1 hypothetical protein [Sphingomonas xinjiangensis]
MASFLALLFVSACSSERTYQDLTPEERAGQPGQIIAAIESDPSWKSRDALRNLHTVAMKVVDKPGGYLFISDTLATGLQLMCPDVADMPPICRNRFIHAFGWTDYPVTLGYPEAVRTEHARQKAGTQK